MSAEDVLAMRRLRDGDDLALNGIMDRWQRRVTSFLLRLTGNESVAVDLAQETFVRVYQSRDRYQPRGEFSTWLFAIAANLGRQHLRWRHRHPAVPLDGAGTAERPLAERLPDPHADPSALAEAEERSRLVREAVQGLPADLCEAVILAEYERLPQAEIAAICGCTMKAVETRLYRARAILRDRLANMLGRG
jgi:RNA polymerase sigma-70 factor (ECF subfamily)